MDTATINYYISYLNARIQNCQKLCVRLDAMNAPQAMRRSEAFAAYSNECQHQVTEYEKMLP
jgi:hypothetical protein